jgi:uncharacterized protein (DUF952 family)
MARNPIVIKHQTIVVTASERAWVEVQESGQYTRSTIDSDLESVGFIHATFPDQTIAMLNRHFTDRDDVILLLVDMDKVKSPIKYEAALSGRTGTFPHIYGPLNVDAVYDTIKPKKGDDGLFVEPKGWTT